MNNLIDRLRAAGTKLQIERETNKLLIEAADEIERLERELAKREPRCTCNASPSNRAIGNHFGDCPLR